MTTTVASQAHKLLRDRRLTAIAALIIITVLSAQLFVIAVDDLMVLTSADRFIQDWEISVLTPPKPVDPDIIVVAVKEDTLKQFPYRSPLDRAFIANLLTKIASAKPIAIGLDYLFDGPTEPAKDVQLKSTIADLKVPLVVAYTEEPSIVNPDQLDYLRSFVPSSRRAMANTAEDQYGTVRFIYPGAKDKSGHYVVGFDRALAGYAGAKSPRKQLRIVWTIPPPDRSLSLLDRIKEINASSDGIASFLELHAQVAGLFPPQTFANKIVLIGSDESLIDRHRTPFAVMSSAGMLAGVVVHAYGVATILHHEHSPYVGWQVNFAVALLMSLVGSLLGILNFRLFARIAAVLFILVAFWVFAALLYHYANTMIDLLAPSLSIIVSFSALDSLSGRDARRQRQFIQGAFSRYVSPKVVEALIADPERMSLEGERREMTYLFTDVADFTTMSEGLDSRVLARLLNAYFEGMTSIVLRYEGMVDKFIGDAVFAIFNAPVDLAKHQEQAVRCALEMDTFSERFRREQKEAGINLGVTRIGVHTGPAVVGNFGSQARFNYTAQGDAVNVASRLEGLNKYFGTHLCVSGTTRVACNGNLAFRPVASVVLKGKTQAVDVWEPLAEHRMTLKQRELYEVAYARLDDPSGEALALFESLAHELPHDPCVHFYLERLRSGVRGTELHMTEK